MRIISVRQAGDICQQYRDDVKAGTTEDGFLIPPDQMPQEGA